MRVGLLVRLAWCDLRHGWLATACLVLGAAIALGPVLLLYGLNYGFVTSLIETLRQDPRTRELRPVGQYELDDAWFKTWSADPRVGFLLPRTRYLASTVTLRSANARGVGEAELVPSAVGDPFMPPDIVIQGPDVVALSASAALGRNVTVGDTVTLQFTRRIGDRREAVRHEATVATVLDRGVFQRDAAFVTASLVDAAERWREGDAVPEFGWEGSDSSTDRVTYASFRLFAQDVRDVPSLRDDFIRMNIDVRTNAESISRALAIEKGLGWVFVVILVLSSAGVLLTLGFQLAAATAEKAAELSVLRMLGMVGRELCAIPMIQGAFISGAGAATAGITVLAFQPVVNARLSGIADFEGPLSRLEIQHTIVAIIAMAAAGVIAGAVAGRQASRLEPSEGLRRD